MRGRYVILHLSCPIEPGRVGPSTAIRSAWAGETFRLVVFGTPEAYRVPCPVDSKMAAGAFCWASSPPPDGGKARNRIHGLR
jgi:hypothetical protein